MVHTISLIRITVLTPHLRRCRLVRLQTLQTCQTVYLYRGFQANHLATYRTLYLELWVLVLCVSPRIQPCRQPYHSQSTTTFHITCQLRLILQRSWRNYFHLFRSLLHKLGKLDLRHRYSLSFIHLQASSHQSFQLWTDISPKITFLKLNHKFLAQHIRIIDMTERSFSVQHLIDNNTKSPDISFKSILSVNKSLRSHVYRWTYT